jgi:hypothetical protein
MLTDQESQCLMPNHIGRIINISPPLTCHSIFAPEHAITPDTLTQHKAFPCEEPSTNAVVQGQEPVIAAATPTIALICKPRGEVSWINRGIYNLQDRLGWPAAEYEEIHVSIPNSIPLLFLSLTPELCYSSGKRVSHHPEAMEQTEEQ